ncbi:aspartyl/glutamyl-tRNA(Asn/Gln) amidotransferase, C subunit [Exophiala oligosperma]|uniref:Aspartyl/glutamyl-tRNA(Asn/Gln) amidotransferase, C subunit n=1 Tax=Exophiala oligosperma TaxID=215243 RepID=A0A0D2E0G4_9EURO|nr:aspartyl/glutamyl-tRNA(Asn/Gln) amidotransferase, C subunit [Exophiala oligosperma]KIW41294.1 aspartyl/glutamyl-tRNA(Asn/Gln) amidotransferase, C subunit [Exophiala oligosperma]
MPRIRVPPFRIRAELVGPERSPQRDRLLKVVKDIEINPRISDLLKTPTWSVSSLMPPPASTHQEAQGDASEISREKLHHLLRLSALPLPKTEQEESSMLDTLRQQVHFVKEIQKVDTTGVEPLVALRDETAEARSERQFTKESLREFLDLEMKRGKNGTIRRDKQVEPRRDILTKPRVFQAEHTDDRLEDPFDLGDDPARHQSDKKRGQYFVVRRRRSSKDATQEG